MGNSMKKTKGWLLILMTMISLFGLSACGEEGRNEKVTEEVSATSGEVTSEDKVTYEQISQEEAKKMMDTETGYVIIDARTEEEFAEGHIEGAVLIPEYEIADRAEKELPDKGALILVYCRSGRRSKIASEELVKLGYTNVKEFGGIIDWPYEIVK